MNTGVCFRRTGFVALIVLLLVFMAACGGGSTSTPEVRTIVTGLQVSPASASISLGTTRQFTATVTFSDGTSRDVTGSVTWTSSNTAVVTINSAGLATSVAAGSATITASFSSTTGSATGNASLTITPAALVSISVSPASSSVKLGASQQFIATGTFSNNTTQTPLAGVTWSATAGIASVNAAGLATGVGAGAGTVTASVGAVSGSASIAVEGPVALAVTLSTPSLPLPPPGTTEQATATATFADSTVAALPAGVTWSSSVPAVAIVNSVTGVVTILAPGATNIIATSGSLSNSATLTVQPAVLNSITVTALNSATSVITGLTQQFTATGHFSDGDRDITATAAFASSDATILAFNTGTPGLATGVAAGSVTVTASLNSVLSAPALPFTVTAAVLQSISVEPTTTSKAKGLTQQFTARGTYNNNTTPDITTSVTWSSSDAAVTIVPTTGLATAAAVGTATITATLSGVSGTATFTVTPAVITSFSISPASVGGALPSGATQQFTASASFTDGSTGVDVTNIVNWSSTNPAVASIGLNTGLATAGLTAGTATISATDPTTLLASSNTVGLTVKTLVSLAITPLNSTVPLISPPIPFTATGTFSDSSTANVTTSVTWASSDALTVSINSSTGVAQVLSAGGPVTITAVSSPASGSIPAPPATVTVIGLVTRFIYTPADDGTVSMYTATATGELRNNGVVLAGNAPRGMVFDASGTFAYVVNCNCTLSVVPGSVSMYTINASSGGLTKVGDFGTGATGIGPRGVAVTPDGQFVYTANNDSGNISGFSVDSFTPQLIPLSGSPFAAGAGARRLAIHPSGQFLYVANHGDNTISQFKINADGSLSALTPATVATDAGPVFILVHPLGSVAYVVNGTGETVQVFSIDSTTGVLSSPTSVATGVAPASLALHPNGSFAYVGNAGSDNIFIYPVDPVTGALSASSGSVSTGAGSQPGGLAFDVNGQFAYTFVANSQDIVAFSVDAFSGQLTPLATAMGTIRTRSNVRDAAVVNGPSPVTYTPTFAFVSNSTGNSISRYSVDPFTGDLASLGTDTPLNALATNPNDITTTLSGNFLYTSNSNQTVSQYSVNTGTGALSEIANPVAGAHASTVAVEATSQFAYVGDSGNFALNIFSINSSTGALTAQTPFCALNSCGLSIFPLAVAVDPAGQFLFSGNEFNSVAPYAINVSTGALTAGTKATAVPGAANPTLTVAASAHPNGRFVYAASVDSANSGFLSAFTVDKNGALSLIGGAAQSIGQGPSAIAIDPTGRFAYVGYQSGNGIDLFLVDPLTGALTANGPSQKAKPPQQKPEKLQVDPSGQFLYVVNTGSNSVTIYSINPADGSLSQVGSISTGADPSGIAVIGTIQ